MVLRRLMTGGAILSGAGLGAIEARYRRHPGNDLSCTDEGWTLSRPEETTLRLGGRIILHNDVASREVMVANAWPEVRLLSRSAVDELQVKAQVKSGDKRYAPRIDDYWVAFAVKPGRKREDSAIDVSVEVCG